MKYRIIFENGKYFPSYFKTKTEAIAFQQRMGGCIQRKIGLEWLNC